MTSVSRPEDFVLFLGLVPLALILGALGFQYLGHLPPCEICMWQRYPHFFAIAAGVGGALLLRARLVPDSLWFTLALLALFGIALSGALGVYHAGIEWHWWKGPSACTGEAFQTSGPLDLNATVVRCDSAEWRLFGLSLAGYNAIFSLAFAAWGLRAALQLRKNT
jgi:disulfide bond formation protein DsbB